MKQFDIVPNPSPRSRERQPYLAALQSDLLTENIDTIVVAPLEPASSRTYVDRLNPHVDVNGQRFVLVVQQVTTIRKSALGKPCASIAGNRAAIIAALDLLFTGF